MRGRPLVAVLVVAALVALAVSCAGDRPDEEVGARPADALTWADDTNDDLEELALAVGSPSRPVDELLGWIAVEALVAAGAEVTVDLGRGDTQAAREALLAGLIDLYWETTGTGWLSLLREIGASQDPDQLYEGVRDEDLEENDVVWLPPAPANLGAAVVAHPDVVEDLDIDTTSDLASALDAVEDGVVLCVSGGGRTLDTAGPAALADAADVRIRPRVVAAVPAARLVRLVEDATFCPFALVERLDPRLDDAELVALEDDVGAFVAEQPAVTVREDTHDLAPGLDELFVPVSAALDTETLRDLVGRITRDGEPPQLVARDWLVAEGLAS